MKLWQVLRRMYHSIKYPVLLAAIVPALVMFGLLTTHFLYDQTKSLYSALDREGRLLAGHVATSSEYGLVTGNTKYLEDIAAQLLHEGHVHAVHIRDRQDTVVVRVERENQRVSTGQLLRFEAPVFLTETEKQAFELVEGVKRNRPTQQDSAASQRSIGAVVLLLSTHIADAERRTLIWRGITLGLMSLLVASIVGVYIANTFTKRVDSITGAIRRIRRGVYDQPVKRGLDNNDELSLLSDDIDALAAELDNAKKQLHAHMDELVEARESADRLVEERTRELVKARDDAVNISDENRRLIKEMNRLLEEERRQIARDIHDQLNAVIVAVKLALQRIQKRLNTPGNFPDLIADVRDRIGEIIDMVATTYTIAREITYRLRPELLDTIGLRGAIDEMVGSYNRLHASCRFDLTVTDELNALGEEASIAIHRIIQEALTNAVKHAAATCVRVTIRREDSGGRAVIHVAVEDNGHGFDVETTSQGIGILSMRERAHGLGGEFQIMSRSGSGTKVKAMIPVTVAASRT